LAVLLAGSPGGAQEALGSEDASPRAARQKRAIEKELRALSSHPWAGSYSQGNGLAGSHLLLAPHSGYFFEGGSCIETWRSYGTVVAGASLELRPEDDLAGAGPFTLQPLVWGERHYLIGANEAKDFCDDVVTSREPKQGPGPYYLREGDETRPVSGRPRTSAGELPCTVPPDLTAHIVAIGPDELGLDIGRAEGVSEGMPFWPAGSTGYYSAMVALRVGEHTSTLYLSTLEKKPLVGWAVTTRPRP